MKNTPAAADYWTQFIASRPEFPVGPQLLAQFHAGSIRSLCDCGCNSYEFDPTHEPNVPLLATADGRYGCVFEISFQSEDKNGSVELAVFADGQGRLAAIEVDYCANSYPMPQAVKLEEAPYHLRVSQALGA
ncbi:hypothetical protein QN372_01660 [Undibacterium sp. RTI2.1]|uniref:hypothetical protein n=1 Tax=unclassified Undibacterium TaxID=2630295 RepID=UPI002AB5BEBC|nr:MULTISPECIES: hypothetical protein [unclassified Undibacterium]MDY7539769.1 hypothetical protein [Undibacterium sp. 5I1]MEB0029445.1 hypothetical protein [Undibacterium sp. RTI2.1]MEB0115936.1 hypothetical protein [Undibacterium sp. RTI2.2]MEB0232434.1 hypothetical protein [Undibacterium sp. 10I3]MEB0256804.1 hypothetical protein [Undibacterium sp. 5I1]